MARRIETLPTPQGVGSNQTATINLPIGPTYQTIFISFATVDKTPVSMSTLLSGGHVGDIRLVLNGDTRIEIGCSDLIKINDYYGLSDEDGVVALHLRQPWARTISGEESTAYGTATGVASLSLEIDLLNFPYRLSAAAVVSDPRDFGTHLRIQRFSEDMSLVGVKEISNIPRGAYSMLGLHLTTGAVGNVEVLANNRIVHKTSKIVRGRHQNLANRYPQNDFTHIDFVTEGRMSESLPMALQDFRTKIDVTEQDQTFKIYAFSVQGLTPS